MGNSATCSMRCYTSGSEGGCFCDSVCSNFGDCCPDFNFHCLHTPGDSSGAGEDSYIKFVEYVILEHCLTLCSDYGIILERKPLRRKTNENILDCA